jgi:hypothetical protein
MTERWRKEEEEITVEEEFIKPEIKKTEPIKEKATLLVGVTAIFFYGLTSLAQTIFNKKVLATYPNKRKSKRENRKKRKEKEKEEKRIYRERARRARKIWRERSRDRQSER